MKKLLLFFMVVFLLANLGFSSDSKFVALSDFELKKIDHKFQQLGTLDLANADSLSQLLKNVKTIQSGTEELMMGIIHTTDVNALKDVGIIVNSVLPDFVTARFTKDQLVQVAQLTSVSYIDAPDIYFPKNDVATGLIGADLLHNARLENTTLDGTGVLVCIVDTGIDWDHLDFRDSVDNTQSRILRIWDQTLTATGGEQTPFARSGYTGLDYGVEYTQSDIEDEIDGSPAGFVRETDSHGHGTHVAGSVAGNGMAYGSGKYAGMAPKADIIVVKAGNGSFPTNNTIDALTYAQEVATELGQPVVVNMSLGGHGNAHDGTRDFDVAVDDFVGTGQIACISAGNEGNSAIHITGTLTGSGSSNITFTVPSYSANAGAQNDYFLFQLWLDTGDDVTATLTSPNSYTYVQTAGGSGANSSNDGQLYISNTISADNSDREIEVEIFDIDENYPPVAGTYTLTLDNNSASSLTYHGWLYSNSSNIGNPLNSGDTNYTIGSPGTATEAITVGSYAGRWRWEDYTASTYWGGAAGYSDDVSYFSSIGPTRDGRQKPDICAPGQYIASAMSSDSSPSSVYVLPGQQHRVNQGTSMSCPVTSGAVALLLQQDATLTGAAAKSLLTSTANSDFYTGGSLPDYEWGYGKLNIYNAAAKNINASTVIDHELLAYDEWGNGTKNVSVVDYYISVKFTPTISGNVTGAFIHLASSASNTLSGNLYFEIWSDNSGVPGSKISNTISVAASSLSYFGWSFVDLNGIDQTALSGNNYHLVCYPEDGDTFNVLYDDNSVDSRSNYSGNSGASWSAYNDFRMRAVVSKGNILSLNAFLEGPYDADSDAMTTSLQSGGYIPLTSPYSEDPVSVSAIPANVTDWVLLQVRNASGGAALTSKSVFLKNDGSIVDIDGTTTAIPLGSYVDDHYIIFLYRNHLGVMTSATIDFTSGNGSYNFTDGTAKYYGNDAKLLETGVYGLYSGDIDQDGEVTTTDYTTWYNNARIGANGYQDTDVNLDGEVTTTDYTLWYNNARVGASSNVP